MNSLNNDYGELVKYLESQLPTEKEIPDESPEQVSDNTQKLIRESFEDIHSDVQMGTPNVTSKGFDVGRFESLMRAQLVGDHKKIQTYERPYISVTELISCIRKSYYSRMKYQIDVAQQYSFAYLYLINKVGNAVHDVIQSLYDHTEIEKTIVSEKFKVKGRVDGIRDNFLLEYKTIDERKFKGAYLPSHYHQGLIYAYILNTEYGYNIDTITIVYIVRSLKRVVPFDLPLKDDLSVDFLKRSLILHSCLTDQIVPDPIGADKEQCTYCSYKKYCKKDHTEMLRPFAQTAKKNMKPKTAFLL